MVRSGVADFNLSQEMLDKINKLFNHQQKWMTISNHSYCIEVSGRITGIKLCLYIWCKLHDKTTEDFKLLLPSEQVTRTPDDTVLYNFVVLFNNKDNYDSFLSLVNNIDNNFFPAPPKHGLNLTILDYALSDYNIASNDVTTTNYTEKYSLSINERYVDAFIWVKNNCRRGVYSYGRFLLFEDKNDAIKFKLTFAATQ